MYSFRAYLLIVVLAVGLTQFDSIIHRARRALLPNRRYDVSFKGDIITIRAFEGNNTLWITDVTDFKYVERLWLDDSIEGQLMIFADTRFPYVNSYAALSQADGKLLQIRKGTTMVWYNPVYKQIDAMDRIITKEAGRVIEEAHVLNVYTANGTVVNDGNQITTQLQFAQGYGDGKSHIFHFWRQAVTSSKGDVFAFAVRDKGAYSVGNVQISGALFAIDRATKMLRCSVVLTGDLPCSNLTTCGALIGKLGSNIFLTYDTAQDKVMIANKFAETSVNVTAMNTANCQASSNSLSVAEYEKTDLYKVLGTTTKPALVGNPEFKLVVGGDDVQQNPEDNDANRMSLKIVAAWVALAGYFMVN